MPLGSPDLLNTFMLGGYKLEAMAPEEFEEEVKAAFRFFFYKNGPTKVQEGRVVPGPITLSFKFNGDQALNAARFLKQMTKDQKQLTLSWAQVFSFEGYLTAFRFKYAQQTVTGSLTYQPTADLLRHDDSGGLTTSFATDAPFVDMDDVLHSLDGLLGFLTGLKGLVDKLKEFVSDLFGPVFAAIAYVNDCIALAQSIITEFGDILSIPFQTLNEIWTTFQDAIALIPGAIGYIKASVVDPIMPILEGTEDYLAQAAAALGLGQLDDIEDHLNIVATAFKPVPGNYTVQDGDSLAIIADTFEVGVGAILQLNPGLSAATLKAGNVIKVPKNGNY